MVKVKFKAVLIYFICLLCKFRNILCKLLCDASMESSLLNTSIAVAMANAHTIRALVDQIIKHS